jgi:hypothetical protein
MACNLTSGISLDCIDGLGGLETVYISTNAVITGSTGATGSPGLLTSVAGTGAFYQFEVPKDTSSYTETINVSPTNGTVFYSQEITLIFHKMQAAKRDQILLLAKNRDSKVVFKDTNGNFFLLGYSRGCQLSAGTATTGVAIGDSNQYSITLQGQEPQPAYQLSSLSALSSFTIIPA